MAINLRDAAFFKRNSGYTNDVSATFVDAIELANALAGRIAPVPVRMADERLTTVSAQRSLREAGVRAKGQRRVIDQAAAVAILQGWLDERRAKLPGEVNGV